MKLSKLIKGLNLPGKQQRGDPEISGITIDSRRVRPGYMFIAIPGCGTDGWKYCGDAVTRGATVVVTEHSGHAPAPALTLQVSDVRFAAGVIAAAYYDYPSEKLDVTGITGTNGKTTTAYLLRAMLERAEKKTGMIGTVEYCIGPREIPAVRTTPDVVMFNQLLSEMLHAGCSAAVTEISSHALDQQRIAGVRFSAGIFTNLSRDHLDYHRDRNSYLAAKRRLFEILSKQQSAAAVINQDDPAAQELIENLGLDPLFYGCAGTAAVTAKNISIERNGSRFDLITPWGSGAVDTVMCGRFNLYNILAAAAAAGIHGVPFDVICQTASQGVPVPGRMQEVPVNKPFKVIVDYAHTDDALEKVLKALREMTEGKIIAVFGCGGDRDRGKRPAMGRVAANNADFSFVTSDNPRKENPSIIIQEITADMDNGKYTIIEDRAGAIAAALEMAQGGDIVLVAGKGHERFQELAHTTVPFDDVQLVRTLCGKTGD